MIASVRDHARPTSPHDRTTPSRAAAVAAALLLNGVAAFQIALGLGAPWGANAYGGRAATPDGVLPAAYRAMSLAAAPVLWVAGWVLLARAGVVDGGRMPRRVIDRATWVVVAYCTVNTAANIASTSAVERWLLGTVTASVAALGWRVARGPQPSD